MMLDHSGDGDKEIYFDEPNNRYYIKGLPGHSFNMYEGAYAACLDKWDEMCDYYRINGDIPFDLHRRPPYLWEKE